MHVKERSLDSFFILEWPKNNIWNAWGVLIGGIFSCRSLHGLALAGHLLLHPAHTADGTDVLHAWDAALPAVKGKEAWGRGGVAILAGTRRPHRMGVCPYWRCMRWTGESTEGDASGSAVHLIQSEMVKCAAVYLQGSSFHLLDMKDPGVYKPLVIGVMLMVFQQMTGINAIMFYAENIFEQAHFEVRTHFFHLSRFKLYCSK